MTTKQMTKQIKACAKSVRQSCKLNSDTRLIEINWHLPYVGINLPDGSEYFFQGEEASNLLEEATNTGNRFNVSVEDAIIWQSQGW